MAPWFGASVAKEVKAQQESTVETFSDKDTDLVVTQPEGFMCKVSLRAKVDLPPDRVYEILTDPANARVFRGIKRITYRKVLERDSQGRQTVEVEHEAAWKFLCFGGTFRTRLFCWQDPRAGTIRFKLAKPGMMKNFEGLWVVQPFVPTSSIKRNGSASASTSGQGQFGAPKWFDPAQAWDQLQHKFGDQKVDASLITLEQSVMPFKIPPPPLDRIIKGIAAKQVRTVMDDLRLEAKRINSQGKGRDDSRQASKDDSQLKGIKDKDQEPVAAVGMTQAEQQPSQPQAASKAGKLPWQHAQPAQHAQHAASIGLSSHRGTWRPLDQRRAVQSVW